MCVGAIYVLLKVSIYFKRYKPRISVLPTMALSEEEVGVCDTQADRVALRADVAVSKRLERGEVK